MRTKEGDNNKPFNDLIFLCSNIILIVFTTFFFFLNLMILLIHSKQPFLRLGFFIIIFIQIILEGLTNLSLLLMNIIYLCNFNIGQLFIIFPTLFNFSYVSNMLYNIRIIWYLMTLNKEKEESIEYSHENSVTVTQFSKSSNNIKLKQTIGLVEPSYKSFHIFCFLLSLIHTIFYVLNLLLNDNIENGEWEWFNYFTYGSKGYYRLAFFIIHVIYIIISTPYLCFSCKKDTISENILLNSFYIYCILNAINSLVFPLSLILYSFLEIKELFTLILIAFIIFIIVTLHFRLNCYYVQTILAQNENTFRAKLISGLKIVFCCKGIPQPNFVDLNSAFIYHSLANANDFLQELVSVDNKDN